MRSLGWGDSVRVAESAPNVGWRSAVAEIVGMRTIVNEEDGKELHAKVGAIVYLIERADGESIEILEDWIEELA